MKKNICILIAVILLLFSGCGQAMCEHEWEEATCTTPKTCALCEITEGEPIGHSFLEADCVTPEKCWRCDLTQGSSLGHDYSNNYCTRCHEEDPNAFYAQEYGFINNGGMYKMLEVTSYNFGKGYAEFKYSVHAQTVLEFKDNVVYSYDTFNFMEYSTPYTRSYSVVNNDAVDINGYGGGAFTIFERACSTYFDRMFVIKVTFDGDEKWFILEEVIDKEKSKIIKKDGGTYWRYYFEDFE